MSSDLFDLYGFDPEYTIDTSALLEFFADDGLYPRANFKSIWEDFERMMIGGKVISHAQVFDEIAPNSPLHVWASQKKFRHIFKDYNLPKETEFLGKLPAKYIYFIDAKDKAAYADPWLIAQAKVQNLKIITQEMLSTTPKTKNFKLPDVCADPQVRVPCRNIAEVVREQKLVR